jgi:hypothetical protein
MSSLNALRLVAILAFQCIALHARAYADPSTGGQTGGRSPDPCVLLTPQSVAAAIGVTLDHVANPTRPTADECFWAVGGHMPQPAQGVLLTVKPVVERAKGGCRDLNCLKLAQSVLSLTPIGNDPTYSTLVGPVEGTAIEIAGLGNKATWANGVLTVLSNAAAFQVRIGSGADSQQYLQDCEKLAKYVLDRMGTASPQAAGG